MSLSVAIAGASGYAGGELLRLLASHPEVTVTTVTAHSQAGKPLIEVHPHLRSYAHLTLSDTTAETLSGHDVVFLALPHGASGALAAGLANVGLVLDCGADHRLADESRWKHYYNTPFAGTWAYGLPEMVLADGGRGRDVLAAADRIAVPGCNVTAVTLALGPGIQSGVISAQDVVATLSVGTSGAGKALAPHLLASEISGSAMAYAVGGTHRHIPEIMQNFEAAGASAVGLTFTPMLVPMSRGILAVCSAPLMPGVDATQVRRSWEEAYASDTFVHLLPAGQFPTTAHTLGANTALIGIAVDVDAGRLVAVAAIDNLVKGTAGNAIQSMNIALGFPESLSLPLDGVAP